MYILICGVVYSFAFRSSSPARSAAAAALYLERSRICVSHITYNVNSVWQCARGSAHVGTRAVGAAHAENMLGHKFDQI